MGSVFIFMEKSFHAQQHKEAHEDWKLKTFLAKAGLVTKSKNCIFTALSEYVKFSHPYIFHEIKNYLSQLMLLFPLRGKIDFAEFCYISAYEYLK